MTFSFLINRTPLLTHGLIGQLSNGSFATYVERKLKTLLVLAVKVTINTYQIRIQQNFILKGNFANFFEKSDLISSEENEGGTQCLKITQKVSIYNISNTFIVFENHTKCLI